MSKQIVKQPNGQYAIWSSRVDDFVLIDCGSVSDLVDELMADMRREVTKTAWEVIADLDRAGKPDCPFSMSFEACIETILAVHGRDNENIKHFGIGSQYHD